MKPFTPIQYILGHSEFCGIDLLVDDRVLIPRPETELLVETVLGFKPFLTGDFRMLDLCTGSGAIAIAVANGIKGQRLTNKPFGDTIIASDISAEALEVARINAARAGVSEYIRFIESDLFSGVYGKYDIISSNPPYIARPEFDTLQKEVLREPRIALDGGVDGLDYYRCIFSRAADYLKPAGRIVVEIGFGQLEGVEKIAASGGIFKAAGVIKDFNDIDRVVVFTKESNG